MGGLRYRATAVISVAVGLLATTLAPAFATTTTFPAQADAFVQAAAPNTNKGGVTPLRVRNDTKRTYVRFNVASLPAGESVTRATLEVFASSAARCSLGAAVFRAANDSWGENTITWNNQPGTTGSALDTVPGWTATGYKRFDVTSAVAGAGAVSFVIRHASGCRATRDATFNSREAAGNRPRLVVETDGTAPPPAPQCSDGADNDGDGRIDSNDPGCTGPDDNDETDTGGVVRETATVVQTIQTSEFSPPSPDPAGVTFLSGRDRLVVADSEVDEMAIFAGVNLWELTRAGSVTGTGATTVWSSTPAPNREPTGLSYNPADGTLFVSNDDRGTVRLVRPGADTTYGTADDVVVGVIDVDPTRNPKFSDGGTVTSVDAEGVEYDPQSGDVFVLDGLGTEVWRVDAGTNGTFGDADDVVSHFDVGRHGVLNPEGLGYIAARDNLLVLDDRSKLIYEVTKTGELVRTVNLSGITGTRNMAGITVAPASSGSGQSLWVVDRGVDNDANPDENDGKLFELSTS